MNSRTNVNVSISTSFYNSSNALTDMLIQYSSTLFNHRISIVVPLYYFKFHDYALQIDKQRTRLYHLIITQDPYTVEIS